MAIEGKHIFNDVYISDFTLTNDTDNKVTVQTFTGNEFSVAKNKSKTYNLQSEGIVEGGLFTAFITITNPKTSKDDIYIVNFHYSTFSSAKGQINVSSIKTICEANVYVNREDDHRSNHVKRLVLHSVAGVGYVAKFRVYYKKPGSSNWESATSGKFSLGKSKYWDCIEELNLPDNTMVQPAVCSILNIISGKVHKEKKHSDIWYVRRASTVVREYKCTGTVGTPQISRK